MDLTLLTIKEISRGLSKKDFSSVELVKAFLEKIEKEDKNIQAFLAVTKDRALLEAKKIDEMILAGREVSVLAGVPFAVKDNILVRGIKCTAGSRILQNYIAPYDATVVKKIESKGGIILGKTNMDEFAMGSSTENSAFFPTKNPHDLERVPGGSSGGSAAATSADMCTFSLGSDTGGSIRQPASFCGVVGLKPTYGAVSRYGLIAMASSLDQIGPITKTVKDARIIFETITGKDSFDSTSVLRKPLNKKTLRSLKGLVLGIPKEYFVKGIDSEVEKIIRKAVKKFEDLGATIEEISLPHTEYALATYYIIVPSEISANLARYDGIKYGISVGKGDDLIDVYLDSRKEGLGQEVRRRIMLGTYTLSSGYYDAYYKRAQKVRTKIKEDFDKAFERVEAILTPTTPTPAFKIGEKIEDPLLMYLSDIFTIAVNLAGLPALSVPCGFVGKLPVGLQIIGKHFGENKILGIGEAFEERNKNS
ncbi:Asp-tRNA(Asn)/Glu-tRNA(Gln) amidotransferase subunit GatA [Patescibacteria group bacterium]